jgi:signal transduction histidine kinase
MSISASAAPLDGRLPRSISISLQMAGLLSALVFLGSSIFEVFVANHLHASQLLLISVLLTLFAIWTFLEITWALRRQPSQPLRGLRLILAVQIGLVVARHGYHFAFHPRALQAIPPQITPLELGLASVFLPIYLLLFLAISRCLIHAFAAAERLRANQLQQQMILLQQAEKRLRATQAHQLRVEEQHRVQLERKLKTSLTAAAVVHEIQQPLATILLNCSLVQASLHQRSSAAIPPDLRIQLHQLTASGDQVTVLIERMRMLLRNVETEPIPMDLADNIYSALSYLARDLQDQGVEVCTEGLDAACPLLGDGTQLQTAVVNLIRNAIQAMANQATGSRRLQVQLIRHHEFVEILLADSGPGFPGNFCGEEGWDLLSSTKDKGMGIGLFLVQTAVGNHRGKLRIGRSAALGGAEVVIELPRSSISALTRVS